MNHCPNCDVQTNDKKCSLCRTVLVEQDNHSKSKKGYPDYDRKEYQTRAFISKLAVLGGILATIICFAINIIVMPHFLWVFYVAVSIFYLLVSLNHTILSASHLGGKIIAQVISLTILLLVIDVMSGSAQWSVDYVVPFVIIAGILLISMIIVKVRLKWTGYISFLLMMIALGFLPLVLYFTGVASVLWPSVSAAIFAAATFSTMLLFANRSFMTQLGRRFHF